MDHFDMRELLNKLDENDKRVDEAGDADWRDVDPEIFGGYYDDEEEDEDGRPHKEKGVSEAGGDLLDKTVKDLFNQNEEIAITFNGRPGTLEIQQRQMLGGVYVYDFYFDGKPISKTHQGSYTLRKSLDNMNQAWRGGVKLAEAGDADWRDVDPEIFGGYYDDEEEDEDGRPHKEKGISEAGLSLQSFAARRLTNMESQILKMHEDLESGKLAIKMDEAGLGDAREVLIDKLGDTLDQLQFIFNKLSD